MRLRIVRNHDVVVNGHRVPTEARFASLISADFSVVRVPVVIHGCSFAVLTPSLFSFFPYLRPRQAKKKSVLELGARQFHKIH